MILKNSYISDMELVWMEKDLIFVKVMTTKRWDWYDIIHDGNVRNLSEDAWILTPFGYPAEEYDDDDDAWIITANFIFYRKVWNLLLRSPKLSVKKSENTVTWLFYLLHTLEQAMCLRFDGFIFSFYFLIMSPTCRIFRLLVLLDLGISAGSKASGTLCTAPW